MIIIISSLSNISPIFLAFIASLFTWGITSLGSCFVFFFKKVNKKIMSLLLGFSAGVMLAASYWSLLSPAIIMADNLHMISWLVAFIGFILGGVLLYIGDKIFNSVQLKNKSNNSFKRCLMLIFSITLHNIPEGLAIGVAYGSIKYGIDGANIISASILALGIGIQNFPEGMAVSLPLRAEGFSRKKSFLYGQLSGIVEPISAVIGAILVIKVRYILPFLLAFAAGAMIYVVVQELIPESQNYKSKSLVTFSTLIGFSIMMILDIALG